MARLSTDLPLSPPPALSPSSIETWRQCPLKFKYTRIDGLQDPAGPEAVLGSFVHEVLEHLYLLPNAERTLTRARMLASELWSQKWAAEADPLVPPQEQRQFRWRAWWCIENLFGMEDPASVELGGVEHAFTAEIDGVAVRGIVDRWSVAGGHLVVGDYKTGKTPAAKYRSNKFFQLAIYGIVLSEAMQLPIGKLELLYLKGGDRLEYRPTESDLNETAAKIVQVRSEVEACCATGEFEAIPSRLCDWCSFKTTICPYWSTTNE